MGKGKVNGMTAGKSIVKKREVNQLRANPALVRIVQKRITEERKKTAGLDMKYIQRQVDEMLKGE